MRGWIWGASLTLVIATLAACQQAGDFFRGYAEGRASALAAYNDQELTPAQRGAIAFAVSDFGALNTDTLETHATPWRVAAAALALQEVETHGGELTPARVREAMQRFGFVYPDRIGNWPDGLAPPTRALETPMGLAVGEVSRNIPPIRLTAANLACAACHAGPGFDAQGNATRDVAWLGVPNTSLDLEAYVQALFGSFKGADEAQLMNTVTTLFPDTSETELNTLRSFVMPRLRSRLAELEASGDRPLPFVNGAPGVTNGVAALRMQLGLLPEDAYETARGFTSIPDLGARGFRTALLYDGAYAPRGLDPARMLSADDIDEAHLNDLATVTAFFTVPSMGVHPERAARRLDEARDVFAYLRDYAPPRFPGTVDERRAAQGRGRYAANCASCHGTYDNSLEQPRLLSFPNWIGYFGVDSARADVFDQASADAVNNSAYGNRLIARATGQYQAPPLSGLWLSAPYLHNASVPTLWQLMNPDERPTRFMVGGHRLDYRDVGIAGRRDASGDYVYPLDYQPWSQPAVIDTRSRGFGNQGHEAEFARLSDAEKRALIEYLKLL